MKRPLSAFPALLALALFMLTGSFSTASAGQVLPFKLQILDYDAELKAVLLSGEFENPLPAPLIAWRGKLRLHDRVSGNDLVLYIEHQSRRPIFTQQWGVWNQWIDIKPTVPELQPLQHWTLQQLDTELQLLRVLYADGSQEGF